MGLRQLAAALEIFAGLCEPAIPLHHAQLFLQVAATESCTYRELEEALGLSNASVSRTVTALADQHRTGRAGLELLEVFHDPREGRRYRVRLSPRGKKIIKQLEFALERTTTEPVP